MRTGLGTSKNASLGGVSETRGSSSKARGSSGAFTETETPSANKINNEREYDKVRGMLMSITAEVTRPEVVPYTLFQNGRHLTILLFPSKLALMASFKVKYSIEFYV